MANPLMVIQKKNTSKPIVGFAIVLEDGEISIEDLGEEILLPNNDQIFQMLSSVIEEIANKESE